MNKNNYLIIGTTAFIFIITIALILLFGNNNTISWTKDIHEAESYELTITDCKGNTKQINNTALEEIETRWNKLSNNGPWMGNNNSCYTTLTITYESNSIVKQKEIYIIDDSSLVLDINNDAIYYTNAEEIISYINSLFI